MEEPQAESDHEGAGLNADQLRSYLAFARYAVRKRWAVSTVLLLLGIALAVEASNYWPRTFSCSTVLMTVDNPVLDGRDGSNPLAGASDLILRHENLEAMIRSTELIQKIESRRPPLLHLKDRLMRFAFGSMDAKTQMAALVGTLENKITVTTEKGDLTIKVEWSDPRTAMELAQASRESFLSARHNAEMSAFEEKMAILEGHAGKLREEIAGSAQQLKNARDEKLAQLREAQSNADKASAAAAPRVVMRPIAHRAVEADLRMPELKEKLGELQTKLTAIESDRDRRLLEETAKFEEMKLRLTPSHPEVVTEGERVAMLSQVPSDLALLRAEVKDVRAEIQQREGFAGQVGDLGGGGIAAVVRGSSADPLPPDITDLLQRDNLDPALAAQLSSTVMRYGTLRDEVLSTRIDLDTAQAAFSHRYQLIVPAELPPKPDRPKPGVVLGGGLVLSVLLALLVPIFSELRRGIIVESWQVELLQLPVLAELHLPPHSPD